VIGQIDGRGSTRIFGALVEGQGLSQFKFKNGVTGLLMTGAGADRRLSNRLIGSEGIIDLYYDQGLHLRVWGKGNAGWQPVETGETVGDLDYVQRGVLDLVDALKTGREPELAGRRALRATELIFATYESSRRRSRIDLPLEIEDSPLVSMVEAGEIQT
jgi:UDP-N-acetylglucosamine 3-dehydrogenase